jgi:uncharacterized protein with HEPN domain
MVEHIIHNRLQLTIENCHLIIGRTQTILNAVDFISNDNNIMVLDAIAMRLQVIGEHVKKIEQIRPEYFQTVLQIDPTPIIRFRDFISHHYEKTDYEIIFDICKNEIPQLLHKIENSFH